MKLKTTMVISGARFLFYDLLGHYQFSDDDENRILRCCEDLFNCVKESGENVTQTDLRNIDDMQAEINRLREGLEKVKNICTEQDTNIDNLVLAYSICRRALNGESEGGKMIKVGQIYKEKDDIFVVTFANTSGGFHAVQNNGRVFSGCGLNEKDVIAEYPTWQEAVNSKEFKI